MGAMKLIQVKNARMCAFCKHWYDPTNSAIRPKNPRVGHWEYDSQMEQMCMKRNWKTKGFVSCSGFECKV